MRLFSSKGVALNFIANLSLQLITAIAGFLIPPLIVTSFGSEVNGLIGTIKQFIVYVGLVEAGSDLQR